MHREMLTLTLLDLLQLSSLQSRRDEHILQLMDSFIAGSTHPAMRNMFELELNGKIKARVHKTVAANRSFRAVATALYNCRMSATPTVTTVP